MNLHHRLTPKVGYWFLVIIWLLISVHVIYLYVAFSSETVTAKGGTFIEATYTKTNYLPYTSIDDNDKFYQSLLFQGCVYPTIEGTNISYRDELCTVNTEDNQRYTVSVKDNLSWKDGTPLTLNDIFFTYDTILKNNYWNIGSLDTYRNITVIPNPEGNEITIVFPTPSIDNMIFFTNFILPAHLLANQTLEHYISTFYNQPVGTTCVNLHSTDRDDSSTIFDLSNCSETLLKYYQVKAFESQESLDQYVKTDHKTIDMIISENNYEAYTPNKVILNKYLTFFFNTQSESMSPPMRKIVGSLIIGTYNNLPSSSLFVQDNFLFKTLSGSISSEAFSGQLLIPSNTQQLANNGNEIQELTEQLVWGGTKPEEQEYQRQEPIIENFGLQMSFTEQFDRVSVTLEGGSEYFPASYNKITQSALYNLNPIYRNINVGRNLYTIKGYKDNNHTHTYRIIIYYQSPPEYPVAETITGGGEVTPLQVIYYSDPISIGIMSHLQKTVNDNNLQQYFSFEGFGDANTFEGKLTSKDYDIVLRSINMGLRKDLSNLFASNLATINPSLYTNETLASLINKFFLEDDATKNDIQAQIDTIYDADVPLVIIGKELGTIHIANDLSFPYPTRLYVLGWRRDFINNIDIFKHISVDRDRVLSISNFGSFLSQYR